MSRRRLALAVALVASAYVSAGVFLILGLRLFCWVAKTDIAPDIRGPVVVVAAIASAFLCVPLAIALFEEVSR